MLNPDLKLRRGIDIECFKLGSAVPNQESSP
jgi:hypothetical protein